MNLIKKNFVLKRDPVLVDLLLQSGHVKTYSNYESWWYSFEQIDTWIEKYWKEGGTTYHLETKDLDSIRAEPEQIAIFDPANRLENFIKK